MNINSAKEYFDIGNNTATIGPRVAVYVGQGTSHSWTWFADLFDREGYAAVIFIDQRDIAGGVLAGCDVFFVSGGDTFAIAEGLGQRGAACIEKFVREGGTYIGTCAGAYLPLKSSLAPLNMFNFVHARIANLTKNLPVPQKRAEKFCTAYGCRYVYHPVREEVTLRIKNSADDGNSFIKAPLYGGPSLLPSDDVTVLAEYDDFTAATEFLIDEPLARRTLIGRVAALRKSLGLGNFYLFGPHLEHPGFSDANLFLLNILFTECRSLQNDSFLKKSEARDERGRTTKKQFQIFLSHVSNARIIAMALERNSYQWLIGKKIYDPEKIRVFLEAIWHRARLIFRRGEYGCVAADETEKLAGLVKEISDILRDLKRQGAAPREENTSATRLFCLLRQATAMFLSVYFRLERNGLTVDERSERCTYTLKPPRHFIR